MIHTVEALDGRRAVSLHICGTDIVTQVRSAFDVERGPKEIFPPDFEKQRARTDRGGKRVIAGAREETAAFVELEVDRAARIGLGSRPGGSAQLVAELLLAEGQRACTPPNH